MRFGRGARVHALAPAVLTMVSVWVWLIVARRSEVWFGADGAILVSFAGAALALAVIRARPLEPPSLPVSTLGFAAGYLSLAAWIAAISVVGLALGLQVREATPPLEGGPMLWIASVCAAPIFEELLYRERLLPVLRAKFGTVAALLLSNACFALPHVEIWNVLGTFLVGVALGSVYLAGRSIGLCIALHSGLNLASLVCGAPPVRLALSPWASSVVACSTVLMAIWLCHRSSWIAARMTIPQAIHE